MKNLNSLYVARLCSMQKISLPVSERISNCDSCVLTASLQQLSRLRQVAR